MTSTCSNHCLHHQKDGCALKQQKPQTDLPKELPCPYWEKMALSSLCHTHRS